MLSHAYSVTECKGQARFCLLWGMGSTLGAVLGIVGGFPAAICAGLFAYIILTLNRTTAPFVYLPSITAVGILTGVVVGMAQARVLAWPKAARRRWIVRSAIGYHDQEWSLRSWDRRFQWRRHGRSGGSVPDRQCSVGHVGQRDRQLSHKDRLSDRKSTAGTGDRRREW